jgi:transposase
MLEFLKKKVLLIEDNAGWHRSQKAQIPDGITVEFLPPYSPELQPAERLWTLVDEPLVNQYFETIDELEDVLASRCNTLREMHDEIRHLTNYHWLNFA